MSESVPPVPEGHSTLTVSLNLDDANAAIEFYKKAFNAIELFRFSAPDGSSKVMHGEMKIGDTIVMLSDEAEEWGALSPKTVGGCPISLNLYFEDCDASYAQAVKAGAESLKEPTDYPWGERASMVRDPYGFRWAICTQTEIVSPEELQRRLQESTT